MNMFDYILDALDAMEKIDISKAANYRFRAILRDKLVQGNDKYLPITLIETIALRMDVSLPTDTPDEMLDKLATKYAAFILRIYDTIYKDGSWKTGPEEMFRLMLVESGQLSLKVSE